MKIDFEKIGRIYWAEEYRASAERLQMIWRLYTRSLVLMGWEQAREVGMVTGPGAHAYR